MKFSPCCCVSLPAAWPIYGYLRWLNNEKAMRLKQDLPYTRTLLVISILLLAVVAAVMLLVVYGG